MTSNNSNIQPPDWLKRLLDQGFEPYIATSRHLLPHLNTAPFGVKPKLYLMDDMENSSFVEAYFMLEAYLLSNAISFDAPTMKMPRWVLVDCVLMPTAIVGFTVARDRVPENLLAFYREDEHIDLTKLERLPISGQISLPNTGGRSMTGMSLFSLGRRWLKTDLKIGIFTKTLSLEVYNAKALDCYYGVAQYDNPAIRAHGRYGPEMEIDQPMVPLHYYKDMTFIYKMKIDFDPYKPDARPREQEPTFWLNANDIVKKREMQEGIKHGKRYIIAPPFWVKRDDGIFLPIVEKKG